MRAFPTPTVATGMPSGICTIDNRESSPSSCCSGTGTPITGSDVIDAVMPGRCAAPPAPAMITRRPRSAARCAYSYITSGVRCARHDADLVRHAELGEHVDRALHHREVGVAAHDHADERRVVAGHVENLAAGFGAGALLGEVGLVHAAHQAFEVDLRRPARAPRAPSSRRPSGRSTSAGRSKRGSWVTNVAPVVVPRAGEGGVEELADGVGLAGGDHVVVGDRPAGASATWPRRSRPRSPSRVRSRGCRA